MKTKSTPVRSRHPRTKISAKGVAEERVVADLRPGVPTTLEDLQGLAAEGREKLEAAMGAIAHLAACAEDWSPLLERELNAAYLKIGSAIGNFECLKRDVERYDGKGVLS